MNSMLERPDDRRPRQVARRRPGSRFIDADEFKRLLASRADLERVDFTRAGLRGVRDRKSGALYLIEAERLR